MDEQFAAVAVIVGAFAGLDVSGERLVPRVPGPHASHDELLRAMEPGGALWAPLQHPSLGWALAAGIGGALVYVLSILAHELGHLVAARLTEAGVGSVYLHAFGGHVEVDDDDHLTAGRLVAIAGAGPLVTAALALSSAVALTVLGWPLWGTPDSETSPAVAAGRVLSAAFTINAVLLAFNLLPIRALDGGQLLSAARLWHARHGRPRAR